MRNPRKRPNRQKGQPRLPKQGRDYEEAVCDLFRGFNPHAQVTPGVWVDGPDGRRELDIYVVDTLGEGTVRGVVECKDFNPATTGPVGIGYVDALESKRRDLQVDWALMCSNAGFTADAASKAKRVGIGLIGAARMGDDRIRFRIVDDIYIRHIRIKECQLKFWPAPGASRIPDGAFSPDSLTFEGRPVANWFYSRFIETLAGSNIVNGSLNDYCRLTHPVTINWPGGESKVERIGMEVLIEGAWFVDSVQIDSRDAIYDWLRRKLRVRPLPPNVERKVRIDGTDHIAGRWIRRPPDMEIVEDELLQHEL
jgi:hypothetical protein